MTDLTNGRRLTLTNDAAYDLVISVAAGHLDTVDAIAAIQQTAARPPQAGPDIAATLLAAFPTAVRHRSALR